MAFILDECRRRDLQKNSAHKRSPFQTMSIEKVQSSKLANLDNRDDSGHCAEIQEGFPAMGGVELIDKVGGTTAHERGLRSTSPWPKERKS
jgi:hypothetical protein